MLYTVRKANTSLSKIDHALEAENVRSNHKRRKGDEKI